MLFVPEAESAALATHELAYEAVRKAMLDVLAPTSETFPVVIAHGSTPSNIFTVKSASTADLAGLKIGSYWPDNSAVGLARHNSTIFLIDQSSGRIAAAVEAGTLNAYRTAAADAVAAETLARPNSRVLAVFGAGHQARFECAAVARVRDIERVLVVARQPEKAAAMAAQLSREGHLAEAADAEAACRAADIIVTATSSTSPLFREQWVKPGTHIASMGSDATGKQELPPGLLGRASLFCDLPAQSLRIGEFQHAPANARLVAIGDVLNGRLPGRTSTDEITIFDSSGLSIQDLRVAQHLLAHPLLRDRAKAIAGLDLP